ncbi:MAG TPA: VWA domain-containing protein, partial [Lacipirellulaceae bacterium]|nr:VWA domain-containing protein [Lacipirellulaceae bacterium]
MHARHWVWANVAAALLAVQSTKAAEPARLITYAADGQTSFALSVAPMSPLAEPEAVDVVVLFDTSASQSGAYRETALAALEAALGGLRPSDRVQIVAVDIDAVPLMTGFAAAGADEVAQAVAKLRARAPLGATNLERGFDYAVAQLAQGESAARTVLYLGGGASMANMLDAQTMQSLVPRLRAARAAVTSYAIGPQVNGATLAAIANHTGGNVYVAEPLTWADAEAGISAQRATDENLRVGAAGGATLASWTRAAVLWPTAVDLSDELGQTYPESFPPLRSDRDTVIVGRTGALGDSIEVQLTAAASDGGTVELAWNVAPEESSLDHAYLAELVQMAGRHGGVMLPTLGSAGLAEVARYFGAQADQLTILAERAAAAGDRAAAGRMAQAVLRRDPGNVQARTVQAVVDGGANPFGAPAEPIETVTPEIVPGAGPLAVEGDIILQGDPLGEGNFGVFGGDGAFLDQVEQERRVFVGMLEKEIQNTVINARSRMATDPALVVQELKLALENLRRTPDLDAGKRAELEDKLQIALREAMRQSALKDELDRLRQEELAAARDMRLLNERLNRRIEREKQLMDRFDALMDERKYVEAEEVAAIVDEIDPDGVTAVAATLWARHTRHKYLMDVARTARHAAAWETMYQIELS